MLHLTPSQPSQQLAVLTEPRIVNMLPSSIILFLCPYIIVGTMSEYAIRHTSSDARRYIVKHNSILACGTL